MVFNENTNHDVFHSASRDAPTLIYTAELTTEHVFETFGGESPG